MDKAIKLANVAGVYIGMMENCRADTVPIRKHYQGRIAKLAGNYGKDALMIFDVLIKNAATQAARRKTPGACGKFRATPWTDVQRTIDDLMEGKGRF